MVITNSQFVNGVGHLILDVTMAQNMIRIIVDPNSAPNDITNATNTLKQTILDMYKLLNTCCKAAGYIQPTQTYTAQELINLGII